MGRFVHLQSLCACLRVATACWGSAAVLRQTMKLKVSFDLFLLQIFFYFILIFGKHFKLSVDNSAHVVV